MMNKHDTHNAPWPGALTITNGGTVLHITFDSGESFDLSAEYLRVESPSAEVKGHGPGQEITIPGKQNVQIIKAQPVGHYAVRLTFDDMHDSGIYSWGYLYKLGREHETIWQAYLDKLSAENLVRI